MKQSLFIFTLIGFITVTFGKTNSLFQHEGKSNGGDKIRFQLETIPTNKSGEYTRFSLLNNGTTTEEGMPELPMFTTSYQIDPRIEYSVEYSVVSSHIEENVSIFPYQGNLIDPLSMEVSDRNLDFYSSDASYPVENLIVSERQVMRDIHLITISVIPYSYNPELQQLEVFDEIEISVNEVGPTQNSDFEPRPKSRAFEKLYSNMVLTTIWICFHRNISNRPYCMYAEEAVNPTIHLRIWLSGAGREDILFIRHRSRKQAVQPVQLKIILQMPTIIMIHLPSLSVLSAMLVGLMMYQPIMKNGVIILMGTIVKEINLMHSWMAQTFSRKYLWGGFQ